MAKMAEERSNSTAAISTSPSTILQTLCVEAIGPKGKSKLRVFLDGGSSFTYITQKAAEELGLQSLGTKHHTVDVFGGEQVGRFMERMSVNLKSKQGSEVNVNCLQIPRICGPIPVVALGQWQDRMRELKLQLVEDEEIDIDILIGTRDYYSIVTGNCTKLSNNLIAIETVFGWTLHGTLDTFSSVNSNSTTTKQDGENLKRFPRGEDPSSKEDPSQKCTRSRPLTTMETPVSQRVFVIQVASELVTKTSCNPGRLRYELLLQEEERQLTEKYFQQSRGLFDQQCVTVSADREVSNVRARACVDTINKLMQRQQTFGPNQNKIPSDSDNKKSDGQTASLGGPQTALDSSVVTAVRDEPANQQLPHVQEEIPPAPKNGLSAASKAEVALLQTETQEASDVNNVHNFSFQIAGRLCVQGEQIPQVETPAFEVLLRYTNRSRAVQQHTNWSLLLPCTRSHSGKSFLTPAAVFQQSAGLLSSNLYSGIGPKAKLQASSVLEWLLLEIKIHPTANNNRRSISTTVASDFCATRCTRSRGV